ncbi:MAG TPA: hypothetical protein VGI80_06230, partial [Pyrinomonadaceae bacterium]
MKTRTAVWVICLLSLAGICLTTSTQLRAHAEQWTPSQLTADSGYVQINLVSDTAGLAPNVDPKLINPWGFSENADGTFRVAANGSGRGILFNAQGER